MQPNEKDLNDSEHLTWLGSMRQVGFGVFTATMQKETSTHAHVKSYYGNVLRSSGDLKTSACCSIEGLSPDLRQILAEVPQEVSLRFYGCGSPIPPALEGCTVLDLGCGSGRDAFVCAKLVGERGRVIGVDMTEEQLEVARRHAPTVAQRFGFARPNTEFTQGYMEDLASLGIDDNSVDVVISNCVINLAPEKRNVFSEIFRVLKPGGELLFSDIFADRRLPAHLKEDQVLVGECLAGAMYLEDFRRLLLTLGLLDFRVLTQRPLTVDDPEVAAKLAPARFYSATLRVFKIASLEDRWEDYGQLATYRGTVPFAPDSFVLDQQHELFTGKPLRVCGNTAAMLKESRFAPHFELRGATKTHLGLFSSESVERKGSIKQKSSAGGCC